MRKTTRHAEKRVGMRDPITTYGEVFRDGAIIELVSGPDGCQSPQLLLWNGKEAKIAPTVEHGGREYAAPNLDPSLCRTLRLPNDCREYGSERDLFDDVRGAFSRHLNLPESDSSAMACFAFMGWIPERLSTAPILGIFAEDDEAGLTCLRLQHGICRHPLLLAEVSPAAFCSLPLQLMPTLLMRQEEIPRRLQHLLRASGFHGLQVPRAGGRLADPYCLKAIFFANGSAADGFSENIIPITLAASQVQPGILNERALREIANELQPRLLMYRLRNLTSIATSKIDFSSFTPAVRPVAYSFAQCFPRDPALAESAVRLLEPQDREVRAERCRDVRFAIVEILLASVHQKDRRLVRVQDLTAQVNELLRSRGEILEFKPEEIGWQLRKLGIIRHSKSSGQGILLDRSTSQRLHQLARAHNVSGEQLSVTACLDCSGSQATASVSVMEVLDDMDVNYISKG